MNSLFMRCRLVLLALFATFALSACAFEPGGVVAGPYFRAPPVTEGAEPARSGIALTGRFQADAGRQATESTFQCPAGMVPADVFYTQRQRIDQRANLGGGFGGFGNQSNVNTDTDAGITCVPKVDIGSPAPQRRRGQ